MTTGDTVSLDNETTLANSGALGLPVSIDYVNDGPDRSPVRFCHG